VSQDPLGYIDSHNPYQFAAFDPVNNWDPFGLAAGSHAVPPAPGDPGSPDDQPTNYTIGDFIHVLPIQESESLREDLPYVRWNLPVIVDETREIGQAGYDITRDALTISDETLSLLLGADNARGAAATKDGAKALEDLLHELKHHIELIKFFDRKIIPNYRNWLEIPQEVIGWAYFFFEVGSSSTLAGYQDAVVESEESVQAWAEQVVDEAVGKTLDRSGDRLFTEIYSVNAADEWIGYRELLESRYLPLDRSRNLGLVLGQSLSGGDQ
jgi:hypothetical protein